MSTVGEQVIFGVPADNLRQPFAELAIEESHYLAYSLQGESLAPQLTYHRHFGELVDGIHPATTLPLRPYYATLVPPLQLTGSNASERDHFIGCKTISHRVRSMFQTLQSPNV